MKTAIKESANSKSTKALYDAVLKYVEANKGKVVVIGGIQVIEWPGDPASNFTIGIRVTGRKPEFAKESQ